MNVNFLGLLNPIVQVLTNIIVGAVSGWVAGKFGVRRGLEQSRSQRAFERRLEWHEQTFGKFNKFKLILRKFSRTPVASEDFKAVTDEFFKSAEEVSACVAGATVYAQRKTLARMRKLLDELEGTRNLASGPIENSDFARQAAAIADIVNRITYELALSIREQLRLDKIKLKDLS